MTLILVRSTIVIENGNTLNSYSYDVWGNITSEAETVDNSIKYSGEYYDDETGFIYLRNRYYDPNIKRFTQEDPIRDELNWYAYCENNPVMFVDYSGTDAIIVTNINAANSSDDSSVDIGLSFGHTSGIYQNDSGEWFYTYWGDKAAAVIHVPMDYMNSLSDFNKYLNNFLKNNGFKNITSNYTNATYIIGDFSDSLIKAYEDVHEAKNASDGKMTQLKDGTSVFQGGNDAYSLFYLNCVDKTYASLSKGKLNNDVTVKYYMEALGLYDVLVPNIAMYDFSSMFMNTSFTKYGAVLGLINYYRLYSEGSPWARNYDKSSYAYSVITG